MAASSINGDRLLARIAELGEVGRDQQGRLNRVALTAGDKAGRDCVAGWFASAGLTVRVDAIGNLFGMWGDALATPPLMIGSHIDTVMNAGRLDGAYGVLAGLEVLQTLMETSAHPRRPLVVAAFTNEEGARYAPDMMGSLVHAGGLSLEDALATCGVDGSNLGETLGVIGYAGDLAVGAIQPHAYLELHIEQGPVLEREGVAIGAVDSLQGISWTRVTLSGVANHAGTTPMAMRRDAALGAARIISGLPNLARAAGPQSVATVGSMKLYPDVINVIPGRAEFTVDLRDPCETTLRDLERAFEGLAAATAAELDLELSLERISRFEPVRFDAALVERIQAAASGRGLACRRMTSGAGHDAQMIARIAPSAMIFVPSRDGVSHNPREHTDDTQLIAGANVLLDVVTALI